MDKITFRNVEQQDLATLCAIIKETWDCDEFIKDEQVLKAAIQVYLNQVLLASSYGKVAVLDGEVVGVIFASIKGEDLIYRLLVESEMENIFVLMNADESDKASFIEYMYKLDSSYEELIVNRAQDYDGTLQFLALSPKARGKGVGKLLWQTLHTYLKEKEIASIYVYTDNGCNFEFYDYQGFARVDTKEVVMKFGDEAESMEIYLYDFQV
ncbi:MAG: GNAT family N-acetyltransferase [Streptococcaceae bacterium]|jgi:N-acetylglutamate synthase-like GNAT family acetyltransferase|nr:GNAT family N-acetyltransferase [Streptococcaceae bacterium]